MAHPRLQPLQRQTLVITGATSGLGLVTARRAAARGARLVLVARNAPALERLVAELAARGTAAAGVPADVADADALRRAADTAIERFGGFHTWINNAGVTIFGRLHEVSIADQRRLFETNYWGVVNGSLIAVEHLRQREGGGALINLGSELSDHAAPLQGAYVASKHAVKGFTDTLRVELAHDGAPVSVTLIKPAALDTPLVGNSKNVMPFEAKLPPPLYAPEVAADAILHAAEHPVRDVFVGGSARLFSAAAQVAPGLADVVLTQFGFSATRTTRPAGAPTSDGNLHQTPDAELRSDAERRRPVFRSSLYTRASLAGSTVLAGAVGVGLLAAALVRRR